MGVGVAGVVLLTLRLRSVKSERVNREWLVAGGCVVFVVGTLLTAGALWLQRQQAACEAVTARVTEAITMARQHRPAMNNVEDVLQTPNGLLAVLAAMGSAPAQGVCFDSMRHVGQRLILHGRAASDIQLSAFMQMWRVSPWFSSLTLSSFTRQDALATVRFEFTANEATRGVA